MEELEELLEQAALGDVIECPECGSLLEPDCPECPECGWVNPLLRMGFI